MLPLFQSEKYQQMFAQHHLDDFAKLWNQHINWFEEPNQRRGGWSGVGQLILPNDGGDLIFFVKKQQNHGRRTFLNPIKGEPTFRREFKRLAFLESCKIKAPKIVFYEERAINNNDCAILVTEALLEFEPLDTVTKSWQADKSKTRRQKQNLLKNVAEALRKFHETGLVHRALYPKHIFIKDAERKPEIALIDLEKARFNSFVLYRVYFDLSALNRHAEFWSNSQKLYFFLQYFQVKRMNKTLKLLGRFILRRSAR
jgi:tRNA A-37 threonylcarbamoyl transferase component Bud32